MKDFKQFKAKSRSFTAKKLTDVTMNNIVSAYLKGDTLDNN